MIKMGNEDDTKDKNYDQLSELLKKHYKPEKEIDTEIFWNEVSNKIDSLFHKEIFSEICLDENGVVFSDENRYWLGLEQYIKNEVPSLKHKAITEHLLKCKECRHNYNETLDKKKTVSTNRLHSSFY